MTLLRNPFSFMGRLFRAKAASWGPEDDRWYYPGGSFYGGFSPTESGVALDSNTAMRLITVHNCVKVLSETVKQLPCHIMERVGDKKRVANDFYLYELLHDQPNSWMTAAEFWSMAEANVALRGNFYALKIGLPGRPVQELIPFAPDAIYEVVQNKDFSLTYKARGVDGQKEFRGEQIFHIRGLVLNGFMGVNPVEYARETMGLGLAGERFLARYFGKGMHPGAVISHPLALSAPAHKNLKKNLKEKYGGLGKSHDLMLVDEGMEITFPTIKLVDAQFLEQMKMTEAQICGLFRVPLMLIQSGDKAPTYASAEQFMLSFATHTVTPILVNNEQAIRRDLMTPGEQKKYYAKFAMGGLLRGDVKTRMEAYGIAIDKEIMNPNEARALEDMNPYPGGEEYRTRTSTMRQEATK